MRRTTLTLAALAGCVGVGALGWWAASVQPERAGPAPVRRAGAARPQGDVWVVPSGEEPDSLNPFVTDHNVAVSGVLGYTHDALLGFDTGTGAVVPGLAERWEVGADGRTVVFHLRQGVRFADGSPVTMEDVLASWEIGRECPDLGGVLVRAMAEVESAEALDERRLRVTNEVAHFAGPERIGTGWRVLQRRWLVDAVARAARGRGEADVPEPREPAFAAALRQVAFAGPGTGPYRLPLDPATGEPSWRPGRDLLLVRNEGSWHRQVHPERWNLAGIRLVFVRDPAAQRAMLRDQALDWYEDPDPEGTLAGDAELAAHYRALFYRHQRLGPWFVVWNHERPGLGDPAVRRALTMLFDREAIAGMLGPRAIAPQSWFAPGSERHDPAVRPLPFDVDGARALLRRAGWGAETRPLGVGVILPAGNAVFDRILDLAAAAAARAGVTVRKEPCAFAVWQDRLARRDFDAYVAAFSPDPWNDPYPVFHSSQAAPTGQNWMHYASDDMDAVLEQARVERDDTRRRALWHEFDRLFWRDAPLTLLYHQRLGGLLHRRFRDAEVGARGLVPRDWWVPPDEQLRSP